MNSSDDSKKAEKAQDVIDCQRSVTDQLHPTHTLRTPTPRRYEGKEYYCASDVAKIIGVTRIAVVKWNNELWHGALWFTADVKTHDGIYLYEVERVMQLKSVYHRNWMRGGYQSSPTTANSVPTPVPGEDDFIPPTSAPTVIVKKRNFQLYPSKKLYIPDDIFSKTLFNLTEKDYLEAIEERKVLEVTEKKKHKYFGDIITPYRIRVDDKNDFTLSEPLDQFHFALLCGYISEFHAENLISTPSIVYRAITGKVGTDAMPHKDQLSDILTGTDKLMRTQIGINMTDYCEKLNHDKPYKIVSAILPCKRVSETTINGNENKNTIYFDRESPLWEIATKIKNNQILSCDASLLDVPNMQNTRMNIGLKFCTLRRILESIAHPKQMVPIITFHYVLEQCRLLNASRDKKCDARNILIRFFEHLQSKNLIKTFQVNKNGARPYSISFTF